MNSTFLTLAIGFSLISATRAFAAAVPGELMSSLATRATQFTEQFSAIMCTETVEQRKKELNGKTILERKSTFDYLVLLQAAGEELLVEESRVQRGKAPKESDRPLLTTNGFSTLILIFHPLFQPHFRFEDAGEQTWNGRQWQVLQFAHIAGRRTPSVLQFHQRDYPVSWQGTAWIDGKTNAIARIQVRLLAPMEEAGLAQLSSDVTYAPVKLGDSPEMFLPQSVMVDAGTKRQRWENKHTFMGYRQFQVSTDSRPETPVEEPPADSPADRKKQ